MIEIQQQSTIVMNTEDALQLVSKLIDAIQYANRYSYKCFSLAALNTEERDRPYPHRLGFVINNVGDKNE